MEARKIIITGGATRIGAAIAEELSGPNIEIIIHYNKSKSKAEKLRRKLQKNGTIVTNLRHYNSLNEAELSLIDIKKGIKNGLTGDLLSIDLRKAIDSIGEITGQITNDEMLGNIFSNFCIGK